MTERYPLSWPFGWKRTPAVARGNARFSRRTSVKATYGDGYYDRKAELTVRDGMDRLKGEIERLGARDMLVSSNVELTTYGEPRSGRRAPDDPGVAVYFRLNGKDRVLACDRWKTVADNLAAIAAHIECVRGIDRYGVGTLDQAFAGYDALPAPGADNRPPWRKVLGIAEDENASAAAIQAAFRDRARDLHPDTPGGNHEAMTQLNLARDAALAEIAP